MEGNKIKVRISFFDAVPAYKEPLDYPEKVAEIEEDLFEMLMADANCHYDEEMNMWYSANNNRGYKILR